jgi:hypothetical protein
MRDSINKFFTHESLRNLATTLNAFCLIEISVIAFFSWQAYDLLQWYKEITTPETFSPTAFWAAVSGIVAAVFSALKYINHTYEKIR